jgi:hypothetical protein
MNEIRQRSGLVLLKKPVQSVEAASVVREATTGCVVSVVPAVVTKAKVLMLPRVWAVAETGVVEILETVPATVETQIPEAGFEAVEANVCDTPIAQDEAVQQGVPEEVDPLPVELAFYRKYTEAMVRRYVRLSMASGRVPSLLGRELFRGHVSSYKMTNFEDVVVFCFDMEKLLGRLATTHQQLIKRIAMQQYTQVDTASMLRVPFRSCKRMYGRALDALTEMLLEVRMLEPLKSCQGGSGEKNGPFDSF